MKGNDKPTWMYYWQLMKWWVDFKKVPAINSVRLQKPEKDYCLFSAVACNLSRSIYKITKILLASRLVKNPIIYCSGKPIENWSLFYKSSTQHFLSANTLNCNVERTPGKFVNHKLEGYIIFVQELGFSRVQD